MTAKSTVAVLLASHNGIEWISSQIDSVLSQEGVAVTLFISDDFSEDGTFEFVTKLATTNPSIKVLTNQAKVYSSARNFYRLICELEIEYFDYVAFADQDDIWEPGKLEKQVHLIQQDGAEGVSSNVRAFWPDKKIVVTDKAQCQKKYDFLFESAGPGCSFLMSKWLVTKIKQTLLLDNSMAVQVSLHDWLSYAICRAYSKKWVIDPAPLVNYRQHQRNVLGVNRGLNAFLDRINRFSSGWYRNEVLKILSVCRNVSNDSNLTLFDGWIRKNNFITRIKLMRYATEFRRGRVDILFLLFAFFFGLF